ncbi:MAG: glycosyl hydrolase [Bacteroidales bacterium]
MTRLTSLRNNVRTLTSALLLLSALCLPSCTTGTQEGGGALESEFLNPPDEARPRVWWHWMNGNITRDGIQKDLEWMRRTGIAGFQNFDAAFMTPQIVDQRLVYMTPEWKEAFAFTTRLADSLHLEMAIAGSPGWSESGGPWVPASEGMKKMVWSELAVTGGQAFDGVLPHPPTTTGAFQNLEHGGGLSLLGGDHRETPEFYADAAVVAYPVPESDNTMRELQGRVRSSGGRFSLEMLCDGDLTTGVLLPAVAPDKRSWIEISFPAPVEIHALTMVGGGESGMFGFGASAVTRTLEVSDDGTTFREIAPIPRGGVAQNTIVLDPVTARFFRVSIQTPPPPASNPLGGLFGGLGDLPQGPRGTEIAELVLHTVPRIHNFEEKAGFSVTARVEEALTRSAAAGEAVPESAVVVLTDRMDADGRLQWEVPEGTWKILRIGYSLTGHENSPASPEATGLEVDKLDPRFVRNYFTNYLDQYKDATGGLMGDQGLQYVITDSWEAGTANWTDRMIEEFNRRNSYEIFPWLPVLTGKIVESSEASEKFLWDFRNTLEAMVTEYHYDELTAILKERNMGRYTESHENERAFIGDGMEIKKNADIPMSATWTPGGFGPSAGTDVAVRHETDIRESASVAHIYGKKYVAAESLTAIGNTWGFAPEHLKSTADFMLAAGLNRFVIHTSVHQPVDDKVPGLGLGPFGQWFTRHETWAGQARPWIDYLARSSYLLQQGTFVADILYVYGQGSNLTSLFGTALPAIPAGFNYDFLNAGAVPGVLTVANGNIMAPSGMEYKVLVLDESTRYMTLPVLRKLEELVRNGAVLAGPKPLASPSLNDDGEEFRKLADAMWGEEKGRKDLGAGHVYGEYDAGEALQAVGLEPDFSYDSMLEPHPMRFVHRVLGNDHLYWVQTTDKQGGTKKVSFRMSGKVPQVWDPVSGDVRPVSYVMENGRTTVSLDMDPEDALFVMFGKKTKQTSLELPESSEHVLAPVPGPWKVTFQPRRGAPESAEFSSLVSWDSQEDPGIRYFSGTASYEKTLQVEESWTEDGGSVWIDLGEVENVAEVFVNGTPAGVVWKKPFRVDIGQALRPGENQLRIDVSNLWVNRLIGDQQPGVETPVSYTTQAFYRADSPLRPSGLLGPVQLIARE